MLLVLIPPPPLLLMLLLALAFALAPAVVEKAAVGVKSASEVRANAEWLEVASRVPVTLWMDAKAEGLLAEDVPVPG